MQLRLELCLAQQISVRWCATRHHVPLQASRLCTNQKSPLHILEHFIRICSYTNFSYKGNKHSSTLIATPSRAWIDLWSKKFQNIGLVWSKYCIRSKLHPGNQVHKSKLLVSNHILCNSIGKWVNHFDHSCSTWYNTIGIILFTPPANTHTDGNSNWKKIVVNILFYKYEG